MSSFAYAIEEPIPAASLPLNNEKPLPHIALLLPLNAELFAHSAEIVRQGFMAAAGTELRSLPVRVYSSSDESSEVVALYRQAVASGARAIVGPLTRSGVVALAAEQNIPVPTLALNVIEEKPAGPLYFFGMAAESEARQVARQAAQRGFKQAIAISSQTQLSKRLLFAFEDEWHKLGGATLSEIEFNGDPTPLLDMQSGPDVMVFLSVDAANAQLIRPYLPNRLATYATSQVFVGNQDTLTNYELNDISFVDMPWLLQMDHPAVMIYPRAVPPLSADQERLYALGIDAFRLIQLMLTRQLGRAMPLDGVTGRIQLYGYTFERTSIPAVFGQGRALLPDTPAAAIAPMFPEQARKQAETVQQ
ncbi:MAG TPA: penicillin-binding protein activator [Gallionella sp.]|nr:penicillin-binding protein activator [Gallionella sp.]